MARAWPAEPPDTAMRSMGYPNFSASASTKGMLSRISTDWV